MKKFFINNGTWLTAAFAVLFTIALDQGYYPKYFNFTLTWISLLIIVLLPVSLSIYYKNKK